MHSLLEQAFFDFLVNSGFEKSSVIFQPRLAKTSDIQKFIPDFALVDPKTKSPLAVFEVKSRTNGSLEASLKQIREYICSLVDRSVLGYVVLPSESGEGFEFYTENENGIKKVPVEYLRIASLTLDRSVATKGVLMKEKKETTDQFLRLCFFISLITFSIALADFIFSIYEISLLSTERMTLLCASIVLVIIPYVEKFKFLGIEIERAQKES